jgi:hypothetical protein
MVWYGDVRLKQRTVIEFLVAEKESVMNIHKRLNIYIYMFKYISIYSVNAVDKSTVSHWASLIEGSEKGQAGLSDARRSDRPRTTITEALPGRADELYRSDRLLKTKNLANEFSAFHFYHLLVNCSRGSLKNSVANICPFRELNHCLPLTD